MDAFVEFREVGLTRARRAALGFALVALAALAFLSARKKNADARLFRPEVILPALLTGPGLFVLPFVLPRAFLPVDLLSRPLPEWDLLVSARVHDYLPLANALIPFALLSLGFGVVKLRPVIAGVSLGPVAPIGGTVMMAGWLLLAVLAWRR